jgi:hypothetical protein
LGPLRRHSFGTIAKARQVRIAATRAICGLMEGSTHCHLEAGGSVQIAGLSRLNARAKVPP